MLILDEPSTAPYVGLGLALVYFGWQLLFCFKARNKTVKRLPFYLLVLGWSFIGLLCTGVFGQGEGGLGNIHLITAAILSLFWAPVSIGDAAAWLVYWYRKRKNG